MIFNQNQFYTINPIKINSFRLTTKHIKNDYFFWKKKEKGKGHFPWFSKQTSGMNDPIKKVQVRKRRDVGPELLHRPHSSPPCSYPISIFFLHITHHSSSLFHNTNYYYCHVSFITSLFPSSSSHSFLSSHNQTLPLSLSLSLSLSKICLWSSYIFTNFFPFLILSHYATINNIPE